jgi:thiamine kinase-like enzyme
MTEETIKAYVHSLPPVVFGLQAYKNLQCTRLAQGLHHLNFKLVISDGTKTCQAVLRLPATAENHRALIHEVWYLEKLKGDLAPNILFHAETSSLNMPILITEFVSGVHIAFSELTDSQVTMLAKKLAKVHSIKGSSYSPGGAVLPVTDGTYRDYAKLTVREGIDKPYARARKTISHDSKTVQQARSLLEQKLVANDEPWNQNEFSLCHGDIGVYNVLWTDHNLYLIDWDDARFGDPADDIAYIFAINKVSTHWQDVFLNTYIHAAKAKDIRSRIETYLLKNYLFDVVWAIGKLLEEKEDRSLIKLAQGEYQIKYEKRLAALKRYLDLHYSQ